MIRFSSLVNTLTMPAPLRRQARAHRTAAPHMPAVPAMTRTLPKVPLLPPESRGGIMARSSSAERVNMPGFAARDLSVIPISLRIVCPQ